MALIDCPDCSQQVSTEAEACPHCGYPVAKKRSEERAAAEKRRSEELAAQKKRGNRQAAAGCATLLGLALAVGICVGSGDDRGQTEQEAKAVYATGRINIRSGPGTTFEIVRKANEGESLAYDHKQGEWYRLKASDEQWVHESVVSKDKATKVSNQRQATESASQPEAVDRDLTSPECWIDLGTKPLGGFGSAEQLPLLAGHVDTGCPVLGVTWTHSVTGDTWHYALVWDVNNSALFRIQNTGLGMQLEGWTGATRSGIKAEDADDGIDLGGYHDRLGGSLKMAPDLSRELERRRIK